MRLVGGGTTHRSRTLDPYDLGSEVGEEHGGEGAGADAGDLDDAFSVEGSGHGWWCFLWEGARSGRALGRSVGRSVTE